MSQDTEQNFTINPRLLSKSPLLTNILTQTKIVSAKMSYWTIGYILTPTGAHTLTTNYDFSKNILPVDEYIPWMYGQNDLTYVFGSYCHTPQANKYLAMEPSIIKPKNNAFADSNTYFSTPVPVYNTECDLITVATDENDCVKRYRESCLKYGFNPKFFRKYYLKGNNSIIHYKGNLSGPKNNFFMFFELLINKIKLYIIKFKS